MLSSIDFVLPFGYFEAAHASRLIEIIECMRGIMNYFWFDDFLFVYGVNNIF